MEWKPGGRFSEMETGKVHPGIWEHLGWRVKEVGPGSSRMEWEATSEHAFRAGDSWIVHGGMVTALLDTAMGQATWSLLDTDEVFLTTDLRTEFYRPTVPGLLIAKGWVVHKTKRVTYAAAELFDASGRLLAGCRGTNLSLPLEGEQAFRSGPGRPGS